MAGTQGSSYSSSKAAAAGNKATTQNLQKGLNASGSSRVSSGLGNKPASSSVNAAAANAARQAAARAATSASQRTATSGYGASRPASANVNAAAARASMMNNQRQAGVTQSYGQGKGDMYGANQTVAKGTNLSAGDMLTGGYMNYKNPSAGLAMAARPNTTVYSKGINQSAADLLQGGYGQYRQAPSMQSTPQTAGGGWNDLAGLQSAVAGMNPTFGNIVAGTTRSPLGTVTSNGEIGGSNWQQSMMNGGYGPAPSQIASINYGQTPMVKDLARVPSSPDIPFAESYYANKSQLPADRYAQIQQGQGAPSIDSVPSLPNYSAPVSVANREPSPYDSPTQSAGLLSPMAGQGSSFYSPTGKGSAQAYNDAMIGSISDARYRTAMAQPASATNDWAGYNRAASYANTDPWAGYNRAGSYANVDAAPASSNDPLENPLYMGDSTPQQKIGGYLEKKFEKIADPLRKAGDYVNGLLGGSGYNDLYGRPGMTNPNARDPLNNLPPKEREKVVTEAGKAATDPEFKALSEGDKAKVLELIKTGMSLADALKAIKTGTTTPPTRPTYRYPQYASDWAGLPSGQTYG